MMNGIGMNDMGWWFGAHWLTMLLGAVVIVLPFWKTFAKAGFSGWLGTDLSATEAVVAPLAEGTKLSVGLAAGSAAAHPDGPAHVDAGSRAASAGRSRCHASDTPKVSASMPDARACSEASGS